MRLEANGGTEQPKKNPLARGVDKNSLRVRCTNKAPHNKQGPLSMSTRPALFIDLCSSQPYHSQQEMGKKKTQTKRPRSMSPAGARTRKRSRTRKTRALPATSQGASDPTSSSTTSSAPSLLTPGSQGIPLAAFPSAVPITPQVLVGDSIQRISAEGTGNNYPNIPPTNFPLSRQFL